MESINYSALPKDWKPARGRGRIKQISSMTTEQIEEERSVRLEKNRIAAKQTRRKKKRIHEEMEEKIKTLEKIIFSGKEGSDFLKILKEKDDNINILQGIVESQSKTIENFIKQKECDLLLNQPIVW